MNATRWFCEAHRLWTTTDCPMCDAEQIADLDRLRGGCLKGQGMTEKNELDAEGLRSVCEALADVGAPDTMSATEAVYWLAGRADKARAEALRGAADAWAQGAWADVMLPKPTPPAVPVIAYSSRVGDWLRERAEHRAAARFDRRDPRVPHPSDVADLDD